MKFSTVSPLSLSENVLTILGNKLAAGQELTMTERLMALSAAGAIVASKYGPGPAEMVLTPPQLPEDIRGLLANYAG